MSDRFSSRGRVVALLLGCWWLATGACGSADVRSGQPAVVRPDPGGAGTGAAGPGLALPDAGFDGSAALPPRSTAPAGPGICGNAAVEGSETCDDGNLKAGDGCNDKCQTEPGYACAQPGAACVETTRCGDRGVGGREECDDGNQAAGDGCSGQCKLEKGWACPSGGVCRALRCGDGLRVGTEQCDDGNGNGGDGCSSTCLVESPGETEADGWICATPGQPCQRSKCGNGMAEGSEQCDDGNNDLGDGCSPFCRREPQCPAAGGACNTTCGDGLLLPVDVAAGQQCDDGNTVPGDGCSADCKLEPGFACAAMPIAQDPLRLPVMYRDFKASEEVGGHPDFQRFVGTGEAGIVQPVLGPQGKPVHVAGPRLLTVNGDPGFAGTDFFALWWKDDPKYNRPLRDQLTFTRGAAGAYQFGMNAFFPIEGRGFGTYMGAAAKGGGYKNFHFTSEVRHWFEYKGNERLEFTGDDDVFVFINKRLAVDLGGVHSALSANITLDATSGVAAVCDLVSRCPTTRMVDLGLQIGSVYEMVVFQAERRTDESNYRLSLANFSGSRTVCKSVCGDGIATADEACDLGKDKNQGAYGTCNPDCTLTPRCGDGITNGPEDCDGGPGCSATCRKVSID